MQTKICPNCNRNLQYSEFWKNKKAKDGLQSWCKNCLNSSIRNNNYKYQLKYLKTPKGISAQKKYRNSENGKEVIRKLEHKYQTSEKRKELDAKRRRNLKWIKFMDNPFPDEVKIHWHHINDFLVIPLPEETHRFTFSPEHRDYCSEIIKELLLLDLDKLLSN